MMRYSEIASLPGTPAEAKNAVLDMIAVYQGNGKTEIPLDVVLKTLHRQDFDVDRRLLIDLIRDIPSIKRISADTIHLDTNENEQQLDMISQSEQERSKEKVEKMAKSAIDIGEK